MYYYNWILLEWQLNVLDLFGGLLSLFLNPSPTAPVQSANWSSVVNESIVRSLITTEPDPVAEAILDQHLKALTASGLRGESREFGFKWAIRC
ncbi:MAG: hypothetical protein HC769_19665 [Cyanobacteria bacterium CRU_2_1]|nr:hypothetical protein [Cyanobacteria bacterium CRU_2_1]